MSVWPFHQESRNFLCLNLQKTTCVKAYKFLYCLAMTYGLGFSLERNLGVGIGGAILKLNIGFNS